MKIIKYIGVATHYFGRPLWEIVLNLKNFGVGRYVTLHRHKFYPEPSFYRILAVEPWLIEYPENMQGNIWVEETYRGWKLENVKNIGSIAIDADYQLIPKHEEDIYVKSNLKYVPSKILPKKAVLPPLWNEILKKEYAQENKTGEIPKEIELLYPEDPKLFLRMEKEGEEPNYRFGPGHYHIITKELFEGIIWDQKEAAKAFEEKKVGNKINL